MPQTDPVNVHPVPIMIYRDPSAARAYLTEVFGFTTEEPSVEAASHAEVQIGPSPLWLHPESPEHQLLSPRNLGAATSSMAVMVPDVDAHHRAVAGKGGEVVYPPTDQPYGYREYSARDIEGNLWSFLTSLTDQADEVEDLDAELRQFMDRWAQAIVSNEVDQLARFTTEDWILIDRPGTITRETFHDVVASGELRHDRMEHEILGITGHGAIAIVRTRGRNTAVFRGETIEADEWTTNILIQAPDGWRCSLTQLTPRA